MDGERERQIERAVAFLHEGVEEAAREGAAAARGVGSETAAGATPDSAPPAAEAAAGESGGSAEPASGAKSAAAETSPERMAEVQALGEKVIEVLRTVHDPEIPVNVFDMGLIYRIDVEDDNTVVIDMTLTTPHCPVAETLPIEVERRVREIEGVKDCRVNIVWDPPWHPGMMSEEARLELGFFY